MAEPVSQLRSSWILTVQIPRMEFRIIIICISEWFLKINLEKRSQMCIHNFVTISAKQFCTTYKREQWPSSSPTLFLNSLLQLVFISFPLSYCFCHWPHITTAVGRCSHNNYCIPLWFWLASTPLSSLCANLTGAVKYLSPGFPPAPHAPH